MNRHGQRFISVQDFISHCRDLNVETDKRELEHYEKIGAMLPVARIVYPKSYIIQRTQKTLEGVWDWGRLAEWPELERLTEPNWFFPESFRDLSDEELVHRFDREIGGNSLLHHPGVTNFQPWDKYRVLISNNKGQDFNQSTAEHYYSYWQVHQLYFIQQYSDLYKNKSLIHSIPEDDLQRRFRPFSPSMEDLREFKGMRKYFDALSFWITVYGRERNRTFATIDETNGVRRLNEVQLDDYRGRLRSLATMSVNRFNLTRQTLYDFLHQLIVLHEDYIKDERFKLTDELKNDIFAYEHVIELYAGDTRDKMADELSRHCPHWSVRTFRHLDIVTKERDYAFDMINRVSAAYVSKSQERYNVKWTFTEEDCSALLDYCEHEGWGLVLTALSGMVAIGNDEYRDKFRRVQMYTNLKNVLTSYEYLLKGLAAKAYPNIGGETLTPAIERIMCEERWFMLFESRVKKGLLRARNSEEFLAKYDTLSNDCELDDTIGGFWARRFLITCLARNYTVHSYPSEDRYYGDLFGTMLNAVIFTMLYTWKLAKREDWV